MSKAAVRACQFCCSLVLSLTLTVSARPDWEAPKDGLFTEKQLTSYIATLQEFMEQLKAMGKVAEGKNTAATIAMLAQTDAKIDALLAKHGVTRPEFEWMGNQAMMAYGMVTAGESMDKMRAQFDEQGKKSQSDLVEAQTKLAAYEAAIKEGKCVLTKEDRANLVKEATGQQQSIQDEIKQRTDEAKTAADEASKADGDAKAADTLAKNPPADVSKEDREEYIKGKLGEVETARTAAQEARDREAEAKKAAADAKSRLAIAVKKAASPDVPTTDEEKAQVKQDNEQALASTRDDIKRLQEGIAMLKETDVQMKKMSEEQNKQCPIPNRELMRKHMKEFTAALGIAEKQ